MCVSVRPQFKAIDPFPTDLLLFCLALTHDHDAYYICILFLLLLPTLSYYYDHYYYYVCATLWRSVIVYSIFTIMYKCNTILWLDTQCVCVYQEEVPFGEQAVKDKKIVIIIKKIRLTKSSSKRSNHEEEEEGRNTLFNSF